MNALERSVLVLNKNWFPVAVSSAADALTKMYQSKAFAVDEETYAVMRFGEWVERGVQKGRLFVKTPSYPVQVPEIIVLSEYGEVPLRHMNYSKFSIFKRDKYTCQYCGSQPGRERVTIDHVVPKSRGGKTTWENCVTSCEPCNANKASATPDEVGMKLRSTPSRPEPMKILRAKIGGRKVWRKFIGG